jgi:rod shape-determining protein MreD
VTLYIVVPLLVVVAILQTTLVPQLTVWGASANLPLLIVVSWSLLRGSREGVIWGFIAGLAVDVLSGAPFGAATLPMIAVGLLAGLGHATVFRAHIALPLVVMFVTTVIYDLLFLLIVRLSGYPVAWLDSLFRLILPSALVNTMLMPIVFVLLRWLNMRFGHAEMEW